MREDPLIAPLEVPLQPLRYRIIHGESIKMMIQRAHWGAAMSAFVWNTRRWICPLRIVYFLHRRLE